MVGWVRGIYPTDKTALDGLEQGSLFVYQEGDRIVATAKMDNVCLLYTSDAADD